MPRALALAAAVLIASPAAADWQNTRWGMTEAEAAQAVPGASAPPAGKEERLHASHGAARLVFRWESGDYRFSGFLYFSQRGGGLSMVRLRLLDRHKCGELFYALRLKYGEPASLDRSVGAAAWVTASTRIAWSAEKAFCEVRYASRAIDNNKGL